MTTPDLRGVLSWQAAQAAVSAALDHAGTLGIRASAALVDAGGHPLAFARMPGTPFHSAAIAEDKAYTAASFGISTTALADALARHPEPVREALARRPRLLTLAGGLPILAHGRTLGAIGVSGGSEAQDVECAIAGLRAAGLLPPAPQRGIPA